MNWLEQNIKGLCDRNGMDFQSFLGDMEVDNVFELTLYDLQAVGEEYNVDPEALLFKPMFRPHHINEKIKAISLLVLDVDGVMTDGGMYFSETGDQQKKFNTKDGLGIIYLTKRNRQVAIISSGFRAEAVKSRADMLGIQHCSVNREPKLERLEKLCGVLGIGLKNVAIVGDDVNDLEVMKKVGFTACPSDAVPVVKANVDVILNTRGGEGCVREFIDTYLLDEPITEQ